MIDMRLAIITAVDSYLAYAHSKQKEIIALIRRLVECESPSDSPRDVARFVELFADTIAPMAQVKIHRAGKFGPNLEAQFQLPGKKKSGQVLALGHSDTVWALGTLRSMPFREAEGRLWGPGVLDMKSGLAFLVFAARALRDLDVTAPSRVLLQVNADEEVGSESSRALTEKNGRRRHAGLGREPGTWMEGKLKTARKGVGTVSVKVHGRASHAGVAFGS